MACIYNFAFVFADYISEQMNVWRMYVLEYGAYLQYAIELCGQHDVALRLL